jgi:hypothetical protein
MDRKRKTYDIQSWKRKTFISQHIPSTIIDIRRLVAGFPPLGQIFSEYFGFPYQFSFQRLLHIHQDPGLVQ